MLVVAEVLLSPVLQFIAASTALCNTT
uniref:Uncharacterized protein n=1 Tax=Arundo donax TaxID=35708 RepID=A0A0A8ZEM1_ARUDO